MEVAGCGGGLELAELVEGAVVVAEVSRSSMEEAVEVAPKSRRAPSLMTTPTSVSMFIACLAHISDSHS